MRGNAAQSIGEPGTQLTMRTFHRWRCRSDITQLVSSRRREIEARNPKGAGTLSTAADRFEDAERRSLAGQPDQFRCERELPDPAETAPTAHATARRWGASWSSWGMLPPRDRQPESLMLAGDVDRATVNSAEGCPRYVEIQKSTSSRPRVQEAAWSRRTRYQALPTARRQVVLARERRVEEGEGRAFDRRSFRHREALLAPSRSFRASRETTRCRSRRSRALHH